MSFISDHFFAYIICKFISLQSLLFWIPLLYFCYILQGDVPCKKAE